MIFYDVLQEIVGVLTLEDVIEKTLRVDIADEGDLADAVKAFLLRNQEAKDMEYKDLVPYMQMKYAMENPQTTTYKRIDKFQDEGIFISKLVAGQSKRPKTFGAMHDKVNNN